MQSAMSLYRQARVSMPWARAWFDRSRIGALRPSLKVFETLGLSLEPCRIPAPIRVPVRRPRIVFPAALAALLLASASTAFAWNKPGAWNSVADGRLVDVEVLVDGSSAPLFYRAGENPFRGSDDRFYFQAYQGRNYSLRLRNNSARRVGVLIAVDGLNVVNGDRSRLSRVEPMYVLDPYESAVIRGWRTSLDQVRRFVFVDEQRSYAERTGQANRDMGWIRVLAFNEVETRPWVGRLYKDGRGRDETDARGEESKGPPVAESAPAPSGGDVRAQRREAAPQTKAQDGQGNNYPGTGWGERSNDPVRETQFVAMSQPTDRLSFRYEYASGLRALGIPLRRSRLRDRDNGGDLGFARPPRW